MHHPKLLKKNIFIEAVILFVLCIVVFIAAGRYDVLEKIVAFAHRHENIELDETISATVFLAVGLAVFATRRMMELRAMNHNLSERNAELELAEDEIKQLKGILPICASCKKIKDGQGDWHQVEAYIAQRSKAEFSHGICPECTKRLYPDYADLIAANKKSRDQS